LLVILLCVMITSQSAAEKVSRPGVYSGYSEAVYDGVQRTSLYVPSYDGTKIAVDVYRPTLNGKAANKRLPVIFDQARSMHRRRGDQIDDTITFYTSHGYVFVSQDRRGEGASFGVSKGFITRDDRLDGKAVIDWAGEQSWSNGKVGAVGCSNQAAHQYAIAAVRPDHLVAIIPECASPQFFGTMITQNGVSTFIGSEKPYAGECNQNVRLGIPVDEDQGPDFPLAKAAAEEHRCNAAFLGQYQPNMHRDTLNTYLNYRPGIEDSPANQFKDIAASGVKIYNQGGWYDAGPGGQLQAWQMWGGRVLIGGWIHCSANSPPNSGFANGSLDHRAENLRWLDYHLKGIENGIGEEPPIYYYTINAPAGDEWRYAAAWPLPNQKFTPLYFDGSPSGTVNSLNDGTLTSAKPTAAEARDTYTPNYDIGLFEGKYQALMRFWEGDMRKSADEKGLTYTQAPLEADMEVTGHPVANLWVTANIKDADFFAVIEDVAPDGKSTYVTDGKIRASHRALATPPWGDLGTPWHHSFEADDQPLTASQPSELVFDFYPTSYIFKQGHRVRVTILNSASKQIQSLKLMNGANPPAISLCRDATHASSITLPVIPKGKNLSFDGGHGGNAKEMKCNELASLSIPNVLINSAAGIPAGSDISEHCKIGGFIDKTIGFEVNLPVESMWNGKFLMIGQGAYAGAIPDQSHGLKRGYATAGTDTGHQGTPFDGKWALNDDNALINHSYRSLHLTAETAKKIIEGFYGSSVRHAYFMGCSGGGRQAAVMAQRFPNDFDGIIAGAPALNITGFHLAFAYNQLAMYPNPENLSTPVLPEGKIQELYNAVMAKCDRIDGLTDGLIEDPRKCDFDPGTDCPGCFSADQLKVIKRIHGGLSTSKEKIFVGFSYGSIPSEMNFWMSLQPIMGIPNAQYNFGSQFLKYFIYNNPDYTIYDFNFDEDIPDTNKVAAIINALDPNLQGFKDRGGKMIMYHGWADAALPPLMTTEYYDEVVRKMGGREKVEDFVRLFMAPGMGHCMGGCGPNTADWLSALEDWVEEGKAPDTVLAWGGSVVKSRPLCSYPRAARLKKSELDPNDPDNFQCAEP